MASLETYAQGIGLLDVSRPAIRLVRYSPNGRLIATADIERTVSIWQDGELAFRRNFRTRSRRTRPIDSVRDIQFTHDGTGVYIASGEWLFQLDFRTGAEKWRIRRPPIFGFLIACPRAVSISAGGNLMASYDDAAVEFWDSGYFQHRLIKRRRDYDAPTRIAHTEDGRHAVGLSGFALSAWDVTTGQKIGVLKMRERAHGLSVSSRGDYAVIRSLESIELWDLCSWTPLAHNTTNIGLPTVAISRDGSLHAAGDIAGVRVFDRSGALVARHETAPVLSLAFSPTDDTLAVGDKSGQLKLLH